MKIIKNNIKKIVLMLFLVMVTNAYSIGYTPWTGMTGDKTVAINPYIGISSATGFLGDPQLGFDSFIVSWGLAERWDLLTYFTGRFQDSWAMARFSIVDDYLIVGLRAGYGDVALEIHSLSYELGKSKVFNIEFNTSFAYTYLDNANTLEYFASIVPSFTFGFFSIYLEINPFLENILVNNPPLFLDFVPGIHFALPDGSEISIGLLGLTLSADNQFQITENNFRANAGIGIWYWKSFDIGKKAESEES